LPVDTFVITLVLSNGSIHTLALVCTSIIPLLTLLVELVLVQTASQLTGCAGVLATSTHRFRAALARLLLECTSVREEVVGGTSLDTFIEAGLTVLTSTVVLTAVLPGFSLVVEFAFVVALTSR